MNPADRATIVQTLDGSLRADARWHALPEEARPWLVEALAGGRGYREIQEELQRRWKVKVATATLSELSATVLRLARTLDETRQTREALLNRLTAAGRAADEMERIAGGALLGLTRGAAAALGEHTLQILAAPTVDPEALTPLLRSFVVALGEARKRDALDLQREKFEHLKAQAERAAQTENVLDDAALSTEDRARRIAEIYGRT
ncbi:MAG: hypothetical protein KF833_18590 [Verrucomicrobiae bacterium]|nr:hypothetical protein [Verrucomicrobiae bacterium]